LSHRSASRRERGRVLPRLDNNFWLEYKSETDLTLFTMFGADKVYENFSRFERLEGSKIDLSNAQTLSLFNLIPVKDFDYEVCTNSGWLHK